MLKKIQEALLKLPDLLPNVKSSKSRIVINLFFLSFGILYALFIYGWFYNLEVSGKADLNILVEMGKVLCGPTLLVVIRFIAQSFIDKNHNSIPDVLEENTSPAPVAPYTPPTSGTPYP